MDWEQELAKLPPDVQRNVRGNPTLLAMFQNDPKSTAAMLGFGGDGASSSGVDTSDPNWLAAQIQGSAMAVTGRPGLTPPGAPSVIDAVPSWAKGLSQQVLDSKNFDPYLGIVSEQGDERVYMGGETTHTQGPPQTGPFASTPAPTAHQSSDGVDFLHGGMPVTDTTPPAHKSTKHGDKTLTATQVKNMPYLWDEQKITETMKRMRQAGINVTSFDTGDNSLVSVWGSLVDRASIMYSLSGGENKVTPWDALDMYKSESKAAGSYTNYQNGKQTVTHRSVTDVNEGEAWSVLHDQLQKMLGRDPTDQELRDYTYRMNQLAAQNPSISKTIARYKNGEVVSEDTQTTGGFNAGDMAHAAYTNGQNDPQYAEYQSATTYFNAALSAIGAIGG